MAMRAKQHLNVGNPVGAPPQRGAFDTDASLQNIHACFGKRALAERCARRPGCVRQTIPDQFDSPRTKPPGIAERSRQILLAMAPPIFIRFGKFHEGARETIICAMKSETADTRCAIARLEQSHFRVTRPRRGRNSRSQLQGTKVESMRSINNSLITIEVTMETRSRNHK